MKEWIDIGSDHHMAFFSWHEVAHAGVMVKHPSKGQNHIPAGDLCMGSIGFDLPETKGMSGGKWQVQSMDPLTVSPSLLCSCGNHGYIRNGRWEAC